MIVVKKLSKYNIIFYVVRCYYILCLMATHIINHLFTCCFQKTFYVKVLDHNFSLNINGYHFKFKNCVYLIIIIDIIF